MGATWRMRLNYGDVGCRCRHHSNLFILCMRADSICTTGMWDLFIWLFHCLNVGHKLTLCSGFLSFLHDVISDCRSWSRVGSKTSRTLRFWSGAYKRSGSRRWRSSSSSCRRNVARRTTLLAKLTTRVAPSFLLRRRRGKQTFPLVMTVDAA